MFRKITPHHDFFGAACPRLILHCLVFMIFANWAAAAQLKAKLLSPDAEALDRLGWSCATNGHFAACGVFGDSDFGSNSGSVYVFTQSDDATSWGQPLKLTASDAAAYDSFGWAVAMDGQSLIVGSPGDDDSGLSSGAAYVFVYDQVTGWTQQAKLLPSDGAANDEFGFSVSIKGDLAAVGAHYDADMGSYSGSVYIFRRSGVLWTQEAKLNASDEISWDKFGSSVALADQAVAVGALEADGGASSSGAAFVFRCVNGLWTQEAKLIAFDAETSDRLGVSIAFDGDTVIAGAEGDESYTGAVYVFEREDDVWSTKAKWTAINSATGNTFGDAVAMSGKTVIVGGYNGPAVVFVKDAGNWRRQVELDSQGGHYGCSVALAGSCALIGAYFNCDLATNAGAAYVYSLVAMPQVSSSQAVTRDRTPTWYWTAGGGGTGEFRYQLDSWDNGGWEETSLTSWTPLADLAFGVHTLYVQEADELGLWSAMGSFAVTVEFYNGVGQWENYQ